MHQKNPEISSENQMEQQFSLTDLVNGAVRVVGVARVVRVVKVDIT